MINPKDINEVSLNNSKQDAMKKLFEDNSVPEITGGGDKKPAHKPAPYDMGTEIKKYGATATLPYNDDKLASEVVKTAADKVGVNPSMLFASAWQEGMNKAALKPDDVSLFFLRNEKKLKDFPVDGYGNYGLDNFGSEYANLKKYLPEGFDKRFKTFEAENEKGKKVLTAAFKTDEDALIAKSAFIKSEMDKVNDYAEKKGLKLDEAAKDYFTLSSYNAGFPNAKKIMDEYNAAPDKEKFLSEGQTSLKGVHKNIKPRMDNMAIVNQFFQPKDPSD